MTSTLIARTPAPPRHLGRSVLAVLLGIVTAAVLSLAADQLLHALGVFPPWGQVSVAPGPYALAVAYRCAFGVLGFQVTLRLAPRSSRRHLAVATGIAVVLATAGLVAALAGNVGPTWYPLALLVTTPACAWAARRLHRV